MPTIRRDTNIVLIDCDNFYVSCERIFCPRLNGRPVLVLSNNDGIVVARSKETKAIGIPMGAPLFQYDDLICRHDIAIFSSNYELYGSISARVMNVLSQFSPDIEIYSIDEAFLSFPIKQSKPCSVIANEIKQRIKQWIGIPVTVGIGTTKTMAKVAVEFAKKTYEYNGVLDLSQPDCNVDEFLDKLPVEDVWGIGRRYSELLISNNIKTALALRDANDEWVREHMTVMGLRTVHELRGIQCIPLELAPPPKQSIVCSRSFGRPIASITDIKEAVATHITRAAGKLRRQHSIAHSIQVFIQTNQFKTSEPQYSNSITIKLDQPTAYTPELMQAAQAGLERIFQSGYNFKRAGIMLLGLCSEDQMQGGFWGRAYIGRDKKAMEIVDQINARFGKDTIKIAACILTKDKKWQMRSDHCSPRYTTRWDELLVVKAGDISKKLSTVSLFWRDTSACCFTLLRFFSPYDHTERACRMATTLEQFSTLQLYGVIANQQIVPWQSIRPAPPNGTHHRLEISLYPSEPVNIRAGITNLRVTVPGPSDLITEIFTTKPLNFSHPHWQQLNEEIVRWLRLPNGLPVSPATGDARIHFARLFEINEEFRPQAGHGPVDAAISATVRKIDDTRARLSRAERANQPLEIILARIEKQQRHLEFLQRLHGLEQDLWRELQAKYALSDQPQEEQLSIDELSPIVDRTRYLPQISQPIPPEWSDIAPADFLDPDLWALLGEIKTRFKITSESSFWRTLSRLKTMGLRTIAARQDKRIKLYYRPELDRLHAQSNAASSNAMIASANADGNDHLYQKIAELQKQQQQLLNAINNISSQVKPDNPKLDNQDRILRRQQNH